MKIYLGSAAWDYEREGFAQSMRLFERALDEQGIAFQEGFVVGDALVSRARSIAASAFLRSDCDVLLTIDTDIWFRAVDAIKLAREAEEYGLIGALYLTRGLQTQPALMLPDKPVVFAPDAAPVETPFISTGFTATSRTVLEALAPTLPLCHQGWTDRGEDTSFWPFYMPYVIPWEGEGNMYLSEDWAFCQRAKDQGFKVWLDPSIRLGHYGNVMLTLEDLLRSSKPSPAPLELTRHSDGSLDTHVLEGAKQ